MTISTTTTLNRYVGNASTTVFPYTYRILAATDLVVTKRSASTLVETTLVYPTDYSVSGVGNASGGSITLTSAPATGDLLVIERAVPAVQPTSIRNQGSYFPETHENVFDRGTMVDQQQATTLSRTFKLPHTLDPASYTMDLPVPVAGQVLTWSTNGLTNGSVSSGNVVLPGQGRDTTTLTAYLANNYLYNVLDYDADPTGATDSSAAIAAADIVAAASGGPLTFPPGTYKISTNLTLTSRAAVVYPGALFSIDVSKTLAMPAPDAGFYKIFSGAGVVVFNRPWSRIPAAWWGAVGDGVMTNEDVAINAAIVCASASLIQSNGLHGGEVYIHAGKFIINATIAVPIATGFTLSLRGAGLRSTYIYPSVNGMTAVRLGTATPDTSPSNASASQYCGVRDLSINGSLLSSGNAVGLQYTEMQQGWGENIIIEGLPASSIGLYLLGSNTTGGLGASSNMQTIGCLFRQVLVATTARPLVIQNADENTFTECRFGMPTGLGGTNAFSGIEIRQGRNNRWFGCEVQGDANTPTAYVGVKICAPVNAAGASNGDVKGNEFYKLVVEGHNRGVWIESSPNTIGNGVYGANFSICTTQYLNSGTQNGRGNFIISPLHTIQDYDAPSPYCAAIGFTLAAGSQTFNVDAADVFQITGNGGGSSVTGFVSTKGNSLNGRRIVLQFVDANVTLVNGANLKLSGGTNFTSAANKCLLLACVGGATWYQVPQ